MDKGECDLITRCDSDDSPEDAESAAAEEKGLTDILQKLAFDDFTTLEKGVFSEDDLCSCDSCKERRAWATECLDELKLVQSYWLELRQYVRIIYRLAMKNSLKSVDENYHTYMKDVVTRLCEVCDPHQLYQRLEAQVHEFVIEIKVRLLQLMDKLADNPQLPLLFISGMLDRYNKLMNAAAEVTPVLSQLEDEHLSKFKLTWKLLNQRLFQTSIYTDSFFQNSVPLFITQLGKISDSEESNSLVHNFLSFDDEVTLVEGLWKEVASNIHQYSQEHATVLARQRLLKEDWHEMKLLKLRPLLCNNNKMLNGKSPSIHPEEDQCEEINLGTEDVCECHVCLELVSSHASLELMDQLFTPALHSTVMQLSPHVHANGDEFEEIKNSIPPVVPPIKHDSHINIPEEAVQKPPPPKEEIETTIPKEAVFQKRADKATQKDQEVQSFEREPVKVPVKKKSIGTDTRSVKDVSTDSFCSHNCSHSKHSDKIKRIQCSDRTDCSDHTKSDSTSDSKQLQCDCCYCEVFGSPPSAPISRNYMEMRERLRFILSKKRTNCKANPNLAVEHRAFPEKKGNPKSSSEKPGDTRNLEELLDFIEGNETKCRNEKKAAKKARQRERKIQMVKKKEEEEEKAQLLYQKALAEAELAKSVKEKLSAQTNVSKKKSKNKVDNNNANLLKKETESSSPQMVTIKRIMDSSNAEPTVTITLRGATPNQDRVLYTLLNGQVCEMKEPKKVPVTITNNGKPVKVKTNEPPVNRPPPPPPQNTQNNKNNNPSQSKKSKQKKEVSKITSENVKVPETNQEVKKNPVTTKHNGLTNPTAIQINNVVNRMSKTEQNSFKIEDLKLPPGITITKVDPSTIKPKVPVKEKTISKPIIPPSSSVRPPSSSEVIVVATGSLKETSQTDDFGLESGQNQVSTTSKKKKNKKKGGENALNKKMNGVNSVIAEPVMPLQEKYNKQGPLTISISHNLCSKNNSSKKEISPLILNHSDEKKKKKKSKSNSIYDINPEEWRLLDSVFAPKDIDLENGDIDDAERELEAFKRFCSQSVPPKRKEKVHLNIKDIILKKKTFVLNEN